MGKILVVLQVLHFATLPLIVPSWGQNISESSSSYYESSPISIELLNTTTIPNFQKDETNQPLERNIPTSTLPAEITTTSTRSHELYTTSQQSQNGDMRIPTSTSESKSTHAATTKNSIKSTTISSYPSQASNKKAEDVTTTTTTKLTTSGESKSTVTASSPPVQRNSELPPSSYTGTTTSSTPHKNRVNTFEPTSSGKVSTVSYQTITTPGNKELGLTTAANRHTVTEGTTHPTISQNKETGTSSVSSGDKSSTQSPELRTTTSDKSPRASRSTSATKVVSEYKSTSISTTSTIPVKRDSSSTQKPLTRSTATNGKTEKVQEISTTTLATASASSSSSQPPQNSTLTPFNRSTTVTTHTADNTSSSSNTSSTQKPSSNSGNTNHTPRPSETTALFSESTPLVSNHSTHASNLTTTEVPPTSKISSTARSTKDTKVSTDIESFTKKSTSEITIKDATLPSKMTTRASHDRTTDEPDNDHSTTTTAKPSQTTAPLRSSPIQRSSSHPPPTNDFTLSTDNSSSTPCARLSGEIWLETINNNKLNYTHHPLFKLPERIQLKIPINTRLYGNCSNDNTASFVVPLSHPISYRNNDFNFKENIEYKAVLTFRIIKKSVNNNNEEESEQYFIQEMRLQLDSFWNSTSTSVQFTKVHSAIILTCDEDFCVHEFPHHNHSSTLLKMKIDKFQLNLEVLNAGTYSQVGSPNNGRNKNDKKQILKASPNANDPSENGGDFKNYGDRINVTTIFISIFMICGSLLVVGGVLFAAYRYRRRAGYENLE